MTDETEAELARVNEQRAARLIALGQVVAAATETFFGLLADARSSEALDQLGKLKPRENPSALLIGERADAEQLVGDVPDAARQLAERFWPGPLTLVLPAAPGLDARVVQAGRVGLRVPSDCAARRIAQLCGCPLTATSANPPGRSPARTSRDVESYFAGPLARAELWVVPGEAPGGRPSTLVAFEANAWQVLRHGAIAATEISALVQPAAEPGP